MSQGLMKFELYVDLICEISEKGISIGSSSMTLDEFESLLYTWKYGMRC